jgi:hypothetical protein
VPTEPLPAPLEHAYYIYDGDGNLVKSIVNDTVTYFVGKYYTVLCAGYFTKRAKTAIISSYTTTAQKFLLINPSQIMGQNKTCP